MGINAMEVFAKITLKTDDYEKGLDDATRKTSAFADKLKSGLKTAAKVGAAAITAASTAIGVLTKKSIENYANYEQLVGGVETLFGAGGKSIEEYAESVGKSVSDVEDEYQKLMSAQTRVMADASVAYKTAGLSANQYMETVTSFSASLIASLGGETEKAADYANMAIIDMADNANKMGSSMESIQNAYQGFAKQNYTMLDNLKLGYGGTATEMYRLLQNAAALDDEFAKTANFSIDSKGHLEAEFSDITKAIHIVQTEMGITGTTAKEASSTIQGSVASMKAAWSNLLTGIADENADLDTLIGNLVDSVGTAADNIVPRISQILTGIGTMVQNLAPIISEQLPVLLETLLPSLLEAGGNLLMGLINGIITALPSLVDPVIELITQLGNFITENLPLLIDAAIQIIKSLADGLVEALPELIPAVIDMVLEIVNGLIDNIDMLVDAAIEIVMALADGLINALPKLLEKAPVIISKLVDALIRNVPKLLSAGAEAIGKLITGIVNNFPQLLGAAGQIIGTIWDGLKDLPNQALQWGKDMLQGFIDGIGQMINGLIDSVKNIGSTIAHFLGFSEPDMGPLSNFHTYAPDMMKLFAKGIKDNEHLVTDQLEKSFDFQPTISAAVGDYDYYGNGNGYSNGARLSGATININVNGANIQDDDKLAEILAFKMQMILDGRAAAFGA